MLLSPARICLQCAYSVQAAMHSGTLTDHGSGISLIETPIRLHPDTAEQMLDLNYVRENLDQVRARLQSRGVPAAALEDFAQADAERRRVIAESDQLNAERNTASREIGAL